MAFSTKILIAPFLLVLLVPALTLANGGDQRVVDGKYLINLSRSPFTPSVGVETSFLASFVDIAKDKLIAEDLIVNTRIAKFGGGGGKREFIFKKDGVRVEGGVMDFKYTFTENGLHEIFFDFVFDSNPQKIYKAPDFLLDVQKPLNEYSTNQILMAVFSGFVIGLLFKAGSAMIISWSKGKIQYWNKTK